ncbi:MAG: sugar phosphate isomerase/epimerase family protein [Anaerovoracaceae bacterium]|jgi:sugar phosphate isomerase/epimerase
MGMKKEHIFVATMADDFEETLATHGIGVEIDHFCTASNMDAPKYAAVDQDVRGILRDVPRAFFHGPFNELHPAAIDPEALKLAYRRLEQAYEVAQGYGIHRMVVHSGYLPFVHFKEWHLERSIEFWTRFMDDKPARFHIYIENVLEDEPYMMADLLKALNHPNIHGCLDTGHATCMSKLPVEVWAKVLSPYIGHVHLHNNDGTFDHHLSPGEGRANLKEVVEILEKEDREITYTLECRNSMDGYDWLVSNGFLPVFSQFG